MTAVCLGHIVLGLVGSTMRRLSRPSMAAVPTPKRKSVTDAATPSITRSSRGCGPFLSTPRDRGDPAAADGRTWPACPVGCSKSGAGTGTNFEFYPDTVTEVVAVEPERRLADRRGRRPRRRRCPSPSAPTPSSSSCGPAEPFDAVVCSLVLCSIDEPDSVAAAIVFAYCGRAANFATSSTSPAAVPRRGCRRSPTPRCGPGWWATATPIATPRHRSSAPDSRCRDARREWALPAWVPVPVAEFAIGRAVKP